MTFTLSGSASAQVSSGVKIATANPVRIFNELRETKDLRDKMQQDTNNAEKESLQKKSQLADIKAARDQFKPGTKGYDEQNQRYLEATLALDSWGKIRGMNLANDQKIKIVYLYDKILQGIAKVAAQKKIDLVLAEQQPQLPDSLDQVTADQLRAILGSRNILYGSATSDISAEVITSMDAEYASGTGASAPSMPAPTGTGTGTGTTTGAGSGSGAK
jgi:Skp family chaperone for outer membrane proteins